MDCSSAGFYGYCNSIYGSQAARDKQPEEAPLEELILLTIGSSDGMSCSELDTVTGLQRTRLTEVF